MAFRSDEQAKTEKRWCMERDTVVQHAMSGHGAPMEITTDLAYLRLAIVNVFFCGATSAGDRGWVLIDAGLHGTAHRIAKAAEERFGAGARPSAIVLTHGHFDHVGALRELADRWDAPIYAHEWELPYLTGRSSYPPPDPTVGGGAMTLLSPLYPKGPLDVSDRLHTLPADGAVPGMPGWRWIYTPGHSPGHVSLWRRDDSTLISGDAVITTRQESAFSVALQRPEIHGPPAYFTSDWDTAKESVQSLASLEPEILAPGHGRPLRGYWMREGLHRLARDFDRLARPAHGRYVRVPAEVNESGVVALPPAVPSPYPKMLLGLGAAVVVGAAVRSLVRDTD
jgi:glyoxylase-like metal-dependent hydrolase (beta-lactamase superfamily II)